MKKFLSGFLVGAILFCAVPIFAQTNSIQAFYNNIKLVINGKTIETDTEPFIVNGRTFVPARFIAEPLGATVKFDETQNAVVIDSKIGDKNYTKSKFMDLNTVVVDNDTYISMKDILANKDKILAMFGSTQNNNIESKNMKNNDQINKISSINLNTIEISFFKPINKNRMEDINNYSISEVYGEKNKVNIIEAKLDDSKQKITITTDNLKESTLYVITTNNIVDENNIDNGYDKRTFVGNAYIKNVTTDVLKSPEKSSNKEPDFYYPSLPIYDDKDK